MKSILRAYALSLKEDCEEWGSPVPLLLRIWLHRLAKRLYMATYGMTLEQPEAILAGEYEDIVQVIYANRVMRNFGTTLNPDGSLNSHCNIEESALLAMISFAETEGRWQRMLFVNGIHLEDCGWDSSDIAERYDYPKGSKFYYLEPVEVEEDREA